MCSEPTADMVLKPETHDHSSSSYGSESVFVKIKFLRLVLCAIALNKNLITHLFVYFVCVTNHGAHTWRGPRRTCRSPFSLLTLWVPGIELRFSVSEASTFTC